MQDPVFQRIVDAEQYLAAGDIDGATRAAEQALVAAPPHAGLALNVLGHIAAARNDAQSAVMLWETATRAAPSLPQPWVALGEAMFRIGQPDKAVHCFREAIRRGGEKMNPLRVNLGIALQHCNQHQQAVDELRQALLTDKTNGEAYLALATSLHELGRSTQAIDALKEAVTHHPRHAKLLSNLGVLHEKLDRLEEAVTWYDKSLAIAPDDAMTLFNRGSSRIQLLRIAEARADWERAQSLDHANPNIPNNLAILELLDGNLIKGFELFESRWAVRHHKFPITCPEWDGSPLGRRHLLLFVEQGLGDALQFCRYVPVLKKLHPQAHFSILTLPTLHSLFTSVEGLDGCCDVIPPYPNADVCLSLLSVPRILKTTLETIPASVPYLRAPNTERTRWKSKLDALLPAGKKRIGLFWRGTQVDPNRTIKLAELAPVVAAAPDAVFVSLQKGEGEEELAHFPHKVTHIGHELLSYSDTAAVLECLDLVITIDTSLAHAAGAMGRETWTFLPRRPDWRWLLDRSDCPWYPTMRLYRQTERRNWSPAIAKVAEDLRAWTQE
jgi:Flp pilus assembly protein TadD